MRIPLRVKAVLLAVMLTWLIVEPILTAAQDTPWRGLGGAAALSGEIPLVCEIADGSTSDVDRVSDYLQERPGVIDALLPDGRGGTRFVESLGGDAGIAMQDAGILAIAVDVGLNVSVTPSVELHERAHLVSYLMPALFAQLMAALPSPARGEYAATNHGEHFSETAARAWDVVQLLEPVDACMLMTPAEALREAEQAVPGTSGFVAWYLRHPQFASLDGAAALRAEAERLLAPHRETWTGIWSALESQRQDDGTLKPLARPATIRERMELRRADARLTGGFAGRIASAQVGLSLTLLGLLGH